VADRNSHDAVSQKPDLGDFYRLPAYVHADNFRVGDDPDGVVRSPSDSG
jgi:hypothetical protein